VRSLAAIQLAREEYCTGAACLANWIDEHGHVPGPSFSAADIVIGYNLLWAESIGLLDGFASLAAYLEVLKQRPAFPRRIYAGG
jgi:glutathione S-transferase